MTDPQELSRRLRQRGKEIRTLNIGVGSALAEANVTLLNEAASLIDAQAARIAELEKALTRSSTALDDWLNLYASELCDESRVEEARERVMQFGTIGYIADVQQQNRKALSNE